LVGRLNSLLLQPIIETVKVVSRICEFLLIFRRRVSDFAVVFDLNNIDSCALLDEEIRAEITALRMFALLPCVLNRVEALGGVF
jgi:hypothetical protein